LALPFVFEELFIYGQDIVPTQLRPSWLLARWKRLFGAGALASLLFVRLFFHLISRKLKHTSDSSHLHR
jgi:hypothetical protein